MRRGPWVTAVVLVAAIPAGLPASASVPATVTVPAGPASQVPGPAGVSGLQASDPSISSDGRWIAFVGEVGGSTALYRHDTATGTTEQVQTERGRPAEGEVAEPSISDDGRWIAWTLRPEDTHSQVWVSDLLTDTTRLVSGTSEWERGNAGSHQPQVSGDGQHVAFTTEATDVVGKPHWGAGSAPGSDVVVAERVDEGFVVSLVSSGAEGVDFGSPTIDHAATRIAFTTGSGVNARVELVTRPGGGWSQVPAMPVARTHPLPGDASGAVVSVDGDVLYAHARPGGHALLVGDVATGVTRTVAERVDVAAGFDLAADGEAAVHVVDGALVLTDLAAQPAPEAPVTAPVAVKAPAVVRHRRAARGYVLRATPARWTGGAAGRVERQWLRDGYAVPGATGHTFRVRRADVGRDIAVLERLVVPGAPPGEVVSSPFRVVRDRSKLVAPRVVRRSAGARVPLRVRVVTTPARGKAARTVVPQGRVRITVGGRTYTRTVGPRGRVTVRLPKQRPGKKVVRVRHVGTPYVAAARPTKVRLVVRPRR